MSELEEERKVESAGSDGPFLLPPVMIHVNLVVEVSDRGVVELPLYIQH